MPGLPCVRPLSQAGGIEGEKGALRWDIYRFLHLKEPRYVLIGSVNRLLEDLSPQWGRDFPLCFRAPSNWAVRWIGRWSTAPNTVVPSDASAFIFTPSSHPKHEI